MSNACNHLIAKLRLFLGGGGVPLTLATAQPAPHVPKDRSSYASLSLQPQLNAWGFKLTWPFRNVRFAARLIAVSDVTPSPKGTPPKTPDTCGLAVPSALRYVDETSCYKIK